MSAALVMYLLAVLSMFMALVCMALMLLCAYRRLYLFMVGYMGYTALCIFLTLYCIGIYDA